jgi:hypothetical protein
METLKLSRRGGGKSFDYCFVLVIKSFQNFFFHGVVKNIFMTLSNFLLPVSFASCAAAIPENKFSEPLGGGNE